MSQLLQRLQIWEANVRSWESSSGLMCVRFDPA